MKNFSKSLLNYYATFTETRFRFQTKIGYNWTNDHATLDFSVYPEFERELLNCLNGCDGLNLKIQRGQYALKFNLNELSSIFLQKLSENYNLEYLLNTYEQNNPQKKVITGSEVVATTGFDKNALSEAYKTYISAIRKLVSREVINKQVEILEKFKKERNIQNVPRSTFNPSILENEITSDLQKLTLKRVIWVIVIHFGI